MALSPIFLPLRVQCQDRKPQHGASLLPASTDASLGGSEHPSLHQPSTAPYLWQNNRMQTALPPLAPDF
eukprot:767942-Hanusia_phi.AAC.5